MNASMLSKIDSPEIQLIATDKIDCARHLHKAVSKTLTRCEDDSTRTAGLEKIVSVKIGCKVMLRRNINVTKGLVNGTLCELVSVSRDFQKQDITKIRIKLPSGDEQDLDPTSTKFEIMEKAFVYRKQFPITVAYGITIHKSQGLSLNSAVVDIGNTVFTCGQAYVALSRVSSLEGLHLINLDPKSIKAQSTAIIEYNRLRRMYRPDLCALQAPMLQGQKVIDRSWAPVKFTDPGPQEPTKSRDKKKKKNSPPDLPRLPDL